MHHPLYRITSCEQVGAYSLRLRFDDGLARTLNFDSILESELFGPLRDPAAFAQVILDPEVHTIVWPSGADFDPQRFTTDPSTNQPFTPLPNAGAKPGAPAPRLFTNP